MIDLIDACKMSEANPETFELPDDNIYEKIKEDWVVKICDGTERFWTTVKSVQKDKDNIFDSKVEAVIDNNLCYEKPYDYGDTISFEFRHIYAVKPPIAEREIEPIYEVMSIIINELLKKGYSKEEIPDIINELMK